MRRYSEAEACDLTDEIEEEQCLRSWRHRSAQCSDASSNRRPGNLKTKDLCTANRCSMKKVDWLVARACSSTRSTDVSKPWE